MDRERALWMKEQLLRANERPLIQMLNTDSLRRFCTRVQRNCLLFEVDAQIVKTNQDWSKPVEIRFVPDKNEIDGWRMELRDIRIGFSKCEPAEHELGYN